MFNEQKLKSLEKILNVDNESANFIIKNQAKYLKIDPNFLLKSYVVVKEELEKVADKKAKQIRLFSNNPLIMKYQNEISDLYCKKGFGYLKISSAMKINHNAKISKSAIENFIKQNKLIKGVSNNG